MFVNDGNNGFRLYLSRCLNNRHCDRDEDIKCCYFYSVLFYSVFSDCLLIPCLYFILELSSGGAGIREVSFYFFSPICSAKSPDSF